MIVRINSDGGGNHVHSKPEQEARVLKNIWVPLSGAIAQQRNVETIANNVANANTPGFKKDQLVFREQLTALTSGPSDIDIPRKEFSPKDFYHSEGNENSFVKIDGSFTDFEQGQLTPTGSPFDVAINGKGFFEVLTPQGVRYTRRGSFSFSREGELVTQNGFKVLSAIDPAQLQAASIQKIELSNFHLLPISQLILKARFIPIIIKLPKCLSLNLKIFMLSRKKGEHSLSTHQWPILVTNQ
jgi:flagellar hook protein FlgE